MIKTLIIVALVIVLVGGMALSRPSEASFKSWYRERVKAESGNFFQKLLKEGSIEAYLKSCEYKNRVLWADIEKDGKTVYSGAFATWFAHGAAEPASAK